MWNKIIPNGPTYYIAGSISRNQNLEKQMDIKKTKVV